MSAGKLRWLVTLLSFAITSQAPHAHAGQNANGALIVHTSNTYNWCNLHVCTTAYGDPPTCEDAYTNAEREANQVVWLLAAFSPDQDPAVSSIRFGILYDDAHLDPGENNRYCGPLGTTEMPDDDWPHSGRGNEVVFGSPIIGDALFRFYAFRIQGGCDGSFFGTAPNPSYGHAAFLDDQDPPDVDYCTRFGQVRWFVPGYNDCPNAQPAGACCFPDHSCERLTEDDCVAQGGAYSGDSIQCLPNPCSPLGACCRQWVYCTVMTEASCLTSGGIYQGDYTDCDPDPCAYPMGACCFFDGHCTELNRIECGAAGGGYRGDGSICAPNPCPQPTGACCFQDGRCAVLEPHECESTGGFYQGNNASCTPYPCAGACCCLDGSCLVVRASECTAQGGEFHGPTSCDPSPCVTSTNRNGALIVHTSDVWSWSNLTICTAAAGDPVVCANAGTMATGDADQVLWLLAAFPPTQSPAVSAIRFGIEYDDVNLDPGVNFRYCGPAGTIEMPDDDWPYSGRGNVVAFGSPILSDILFRFYAFRVNGGTDGAYFGTAPNPTYGHAAFLDDQVPPQIEYCTRFGRAMWFEQGYNDCPLTQPDMGACCFPDFSCERLMESDCLLQGGSYRGNFASCLPNPCPPVGACCRPHTYCAVGIEAGCLSSGGTYQGDNTDCDPDPCVYPTGACCFVDGHCTELTLMECNAGTYRGDGSVCSPNPCPQPTGACCFPDGRCTALESHECESMGGSYKGNDTSCTPYPCPGACCYPDSSCLVVTAAECTAQAGEFHGSAACDPSPCVARTNQNGALVVHTLDTWSWSNLTICTAAAGDPVVCANAGTMATRDADQVLWLLAAFPPTQSPAVSAIRFGIEYDDVNLDPGVNFRCCGPAGTIEIPDDDWPYSGRGNVVAFGSPILSDILFRFYAFRVNGGTDGAYFGTAPNPSYEHAAFLDDQEPPRIEYCTRFGHMRWFQLGHNDCPVTLPYIGACCFGDGHCERITRDECSLASGAYEGDFTYCDPNPCPPIGACCSVQGTCSMEHQPECIDSGGIYLGDGELCLPNPCPPAGACCHTDGGCSVITEGACGPSGIWRGEGTGCDPDPCLTGACCFIAACDTYSPEACAARGGSYQGNGTACSPDLCATSAIDTQPVPSTVIVTASPVPSSGEVRILFGVPSLSGIDLRIYDASGSVVRSLECGTRAAGFHSVRWDGRDDSGQQLPAGIYFVRVLPSGVNARVVITR